MHEQYWDELDKRDRRETARRAKCEYTPESDSFTILLLNQQYEADLAHRTVRVLTEGIAGSDAGFIEQLCILAYLVHAKDLPQAGNLVTANKLDPGGFFFRGSHRLPVEKLKETCGSDPQRLRRIGHRLAATAKAFGDASVEILVLPRIPLTLIIWGADEEFPARASILFDQSASIQLPLDVLYAAAKLAIHSVVTIAKSII